LSRRKVKVEWKRLRVETLGYAGSECQKASQFLEMALGKQTTASLKPEFYSQTRTEGSIENNS